MKNEGVNNQHFPKRYLNYVKIHLQRNDKEYGNGDGKVTIGEIGSSLWNNLVTNVHMPSESQHKFITETLKKYAKDDGTFSLEEYQALKQDKEYKTFIQKNDLTAWYKR